MMRGARDVRLLIEIVVALVIAEMAIMYALPSLVPNASGIREALYDAALLALIVGPFTVWRLNVASKREADPRLDLETVAWFGRAIAAAIAVGVLLSVFAFTQSRESIRAEAIARFEKLAERTVSEIQRSINQPVYGLKGARGVYAASQDVSRSEFEAYVASRDLKTEFPGAIGFGFIERVERDDLDAFIQRERADAAPSFTVKSDPAPGSMLVDAPDLYVIKFVYPLDANREAWGYDVGSELVRREAVERAVRTGEPAISGRISLLQDHKQRTGFLYLVPVYRNGENRTTPQERMAALDGLVYAPIVLEEALADLTAASNDLVQAEIFDGTTLEAANVLYGSSFEHDHQDHTRNDGDFLGQYRLSVGGREWSVMIRSTPSFDATVDQHTPLVIALVGLTLTAMMAATLWGVGNSRRRAVQLAERMTRDLKRLSMIAERTSNAVVITDAAQRIEWVNDGFTRLTGYTLDEVRGRIPGHFLQCEGSDPKAVAHMRQQLAAGRGCEVEILNKGKDGRVYIVAVEIQPLRGPQGDLHGFMAIESDVTDRVRAREHIERQEALLRETGEVAGVGGWMIDLRTSVHIWSEQTRSIFEVDDEFAPTLERMVEFFVDDASATVADALSRATLRAEPFDLEVPLRTARERKIWVRMVGRAACEDGAAIRLYGAIQDVTNQRAANIALAASEGRFRTLIEHAPAAIAMFDRDMRYIACSRQWLTEYNLLDRGDIIGRSHYDVFPEVPLRWKRIHELVLAGHIQSNSRDPFLREDGHTQWLQWEVRPWHTRDGAIAGMVMFTRDISEQVAQENVIREQAERLDLTIRSANLGTWDWNVMTGAVAFNEIAQTMLGYEPGEWKPHVSAWEQLVHPDDRSEVERLLTQHLEGRSTDYRCEHRLRRKDGTWAWVLDVGRVIERDEDGRAVRAMGIHMDITATREAAEAVKAAQLVAEAANRAKSEFLANMSHEIRTPMTAIVGYADLLMDPSEINGGWRDHVETIKRNGEHLLTIINDILDLSKIEAGKMNVESIAMNPAQVLADVESLMRVRAKAKAIGLGVEYATPIPTQIHSDPVRFKQILVNLVGNAIKFTELGSVRIVASFDVAGPQGPAFTVRVIDSGVGMTQEHIDRLFLAFSQGDTSTTRRFGGTGLGLRISKSLAEMLGGHISVQSTPEVGSTFTLTIPTGPVAALVTPRSTPEPADQRSSVSTAPTLQGVLNGVRIFFAEDGPDNQRLIGHHLRKAGATVRIFENGRLALEALTADGTVAGPLADPPRCDIILTDMQMPEIDGYSLARTLRERGWTRPIVALTAHAMSGDAERCIEAGCDRYATKPIEPAALIAACRIDSSSPHSHA